MKKTLLLLFAFMASLSGAWAQEPTNLANGAEVSFAPAEDGLETTINGGNVLANMVDGNDGTSWQVQYTGSNSFTAVIFHLASESTFNTVLINQASDRYATKFKLYKSDDGATWGEPFATIEGVVSGKFAVNFEAVTTQYVKYVSEKADKNITDIWGESVKEFQLYNLGTPLALASVSISAPTNTISVGGSALTFTAQGHANQLDALFPLSDIVWNSSDTGAATIDNGVLTAVAAGTTDVTATSGGKTSEPFTVTVTAPVPAIPAIVSDSHQFGIFSNDLGNATGYGWDSWGGGSGEAVQIQGKNAYSISSFHFFGSGFTKMDATDYTTLHVDVYPYFTGTLAIVPIIRNSEDTENESEKGLQFDVTANTWNPLELSLDDLADIGVDMSRMYQIKYVDRVDVNHSPVNGDGTHSFIVGNVYLYGTPVVDTENPEMTSVTVASTTHRTATLTVHAIDNNTTGTLTYKVKNRSAEVVGTGTGKQGVYVTVVINGLTASTNYSAGDFTITATDHAGNVSNAMDVPAFSTTVAPAGLELTAGGHTILIQGKHFVNLDENNWQVIITSDDDLSGLGGSYWHASADERMDGTGDGNKTKMVISGDKKTMTITTTKTSDGAPSMYTPLYVMMPGEINFCEGSYFNEKMEWVEYASITPAHDKTTYVTTAALDFTAVDGLDAYIATAASSASVTMTKVNAAVPAGTPLMLIGTAGTTYNVPVAATASAPEGNLLVAGDGSTVIGGTSRYDYILYSDGKFYRANEGALAAGKAYLHLGTAPSANTLSVVFDDETTGISEIKKMRNGENEKCFDLMGRKVAQPTKGLYIVNGRKVVIK